MSYNPQAANTFDYAGNPNGHVAGNAANALYTGSPADQCENTLTGDTWICTTTGNAGAAVWVQTYTFGTTQISALTTTQLALLTSELVLSALTTTQVVSLTTTQFNAFTSTQFGAMTSTALDAMALNFGPGAIPSTAIGSLSSQGVTLNIPAGTTTTLTSLTSQVFVVGGTTTQITALTLPASPAYNTVSIKDANGAAQTGNITVSGNGHNIDGSASDTIRVNYGAPEYSWNAATSLWSKI